MSSLTPYKSRSVSPNQVVDPSLERIILVDQLPSDAWTEGLIIRPCGQIIVTRIDESEVYAVDVNTKRSFPDTSGDDYYDFEPPKLLYSIPDTNAIVGICALTGTEREEYVLVASYMDIVKGDYRDVAVWRMTFDSGDKDAQPTFSKVTDMPDALFCLGIVTISDTTIIIADTMKFCVWRLDLPTRQISVLFDDPDSMSPATPQEIFGINRISVAGGYLWYTNTSSGVLCRAPIEYINNKQDISIAGPAETVAHGLKHADGLVMRRDATAGYIACFVEGIVWKVDIDPKTGKGNVNIMMEGLITPTAMALHYKESREKPTLYILCVGAIPVGLIDGDRGVWLTLANVDKSKLHITVTVTTEITYEYI